MMLLLTLAIAAPIGPYYDYAAPPQSGEKYQSGSYRAWVPPSAKTIRAVIIRQHGCGRAGLNHADDLQWQALAEKHSAVLVGSHFVQDKECKDWFDPANGSERAFLSALKHFAQVSGHAEIEEMPWAIWGHSGGSLWACHLLCRHPQRVAAIVARSQALTEYPPAALAIPVLFNYGEREKTGRFAPVFVNSSKAYDTYRPQGALWTTAVDPKSEHDCGKSRRVAISFLDAILMARLTGTAKLKPAPKGIDTPTGYAPTEAFAKVLTEFVKTGDVLDTTPPPAPTDVIVSAAPGKGGMSITWKAIADLESGIQEFVIYRDGVKLGVLSGTKSKSNPNGFFQTWNYGDEPEPKSVSMSWSDPSGTPQTVYEVSAINQFGLESAKSGRK